MISFLRMLLKRAWWGACAASLVPLGLKAAHRNMGHWKVSQWSWPEAAAPAAALLVVETVGWGCAWCVRNRKSKSSSSPHAVPRGRRRAAQAV